MCECSPRHPNGFWVWGFTHVSKFLYLVHKSNIGREPWQQQKEKTKWKRWKNRGKKSTQMNTLTCTRTAWIRKEQCQATRSKIWKRKKIIYINPIDSYKVEFILISHALCWFPARSTRNRHAAFFICYIFLCDTHIENCCCTVKSEPTLALETRKKNYKKDCRWACVCMYKFLWKITKTIWTATEKIQFTFRLQ